MLLFYLFLIFLKYFFFNFYLFMIVTQRERERETETQAEGEAGSMHREPDVGFDPGSPGSRPGPKAGAKPLRHPGIPTCHVLMLLQKQTKHTHTHTHTHTHIYLFIYLFIYFLFIPDSRRTTQRTFDTSQFLVTLRSSNNSMNCQN